MIYDIRYLLASLPTISTDKEFILFIYLFIYIKEQFLLYLRLERIDVM